MLAIIFFTLFSVIPIFSASSMRVRRGLSASSLNTDSSDLLGTLLGTLLGSLLGSLLGTLLGTSSFMFSI